CDKTGPEGTRRAAEVPAVWGAGLAQRSEPERSGGERSGASPAPQTAPRNDPAAPPAFPQAAVEGDPQRSQNGFVAKEAEVADEVDAAWQEIAQGLEAGPLGEGAPTPPPLSGRGYNRGRRLVKKVDAKAQAMTPEQRLLLLDTWQRSGLPAGDF